MSRIGKQPIPVPSGVSLRVDGATVIAEGPKGKAQHTLGPKVGAEVADGVLRVVRKDDSRQARALHGLSRKLIANMVQGVSAGFSRTLEIIGVGYRAEVRGSNLHLSLGYSHPIVYQLPPGVSAAVERQVVITLQSSDRKLLGQVAADIRQLRPPEPYKGKGVKYANETIRRKAGKAAGAAGS